MSGGYYFRIGINLGDVIVEGADIYGDGVNVAARLEGIAEPGAHLHLGAVRDLVRDPTEVVLEDLGEKALKNIAEPVRVFRIDAPDRAGLRQRDRTPPLPDKPSIAVLPFTNMSGDAEQEYFSDGMTEDLITDLSKISALFVIARNSTFAYKGQSVKVQEIGRELGVRFVLEGSIRRPAIACGSLRSSSMPQAAVTCGPSGSIAISPTSSPRRTRSRFA